ncbi:DMT family transporter [Solibacillus sp. R5-41]|uniref:DMT family transporter n=1 Tax=Solibacillus sp. R5-41 TaxID=2048654 RepID=UPI00210FFECB|nr:DMT family transporter [Solibacillus sp. R5-41]
MGIFMILFTLLGGITLSAQSAINGTFSRKAGTIEITFLIFVTGSMFLALLYRIPENRKNPQTLIYQGLWAFKCFLS